MLYIYSLVFQQIVTNKLTVDFCNSKFIVRLTKALQK